MLQNIIVVGGNGFIGSAVCRAALAQGMQVTSISSSGRPFRTPGGHSPSWTAKVNWLAADVFEPDSYSRLLSDKTTVVHTLGTLLEDTGYKKSVREGDVVGLAGSFLRSVTGIRAGGSNPLDADNQKVQRSYERLNRDSALRVCESYLSNSGNSVDATRRAFIYISAEDIFQPFIPSRYIDTKRQAERGIASLLRNAPTHRGVFVRPSLVYHAHYRPFTTPFATILDISSTIHRSVPPGLPTPSGILRSLSSSTSGTLFDAPTSPLNSLANALTIPPIHVDHVAEAVCKVIVDDSIEGVVDVSHMRDIIGWSLKPESKSHMVHSRPSAH